MGTRVGNPYSVYLGLGSLKDLHPDAIQRLPLHIKEGLEGRGPYADDIRLLNQQKPRAVKGLHVPESLFGGSSCSSDAVVKLDMAG
eukprot:3004044-Amphidinium_carterae.1